MIVESHLSLRTEEQDGALRMFLSGELDMATSLIAKQALAAAQDKRRSVVVDLGELTFMDSNGVHILVDAARRADRAGDHLRIVNSRAPVRRLFQVTGNPFLGAQ